MGIPTGKYDGELTVWHCVFVFYILANGVKAMTNMTNSDIYLKQRGEQPLFCFVFWRFKRNRGDRGGNRRRRGRT